MFLQEYFLKLELALVCSFCFWVLLPSLLTGDLVFIKQRKLENISSSKTVGCCLDN